MARLGRRRTGSNAAKRLQRREAHGMQVRLDEECLNGATTAGLERLAAWLGVAPPDTARPEPEGWRRRTLVLAILREEGWLATCRRSERWDASPSRRPRPM